MGVLLVILFFVFMHRCCKEENVPLAYLVFEWLLGISLLIAAAILE